MSDTLVSVKRGAFIERIHKGSVSAVGADGRTYGSVGNDRYRTFFRSAAKPIQAMLAITSGAAEKFGLDDRDISVMCGSHYAEHFHREAVLSILDKAGVPLSALKSPAARSISHKRMIEQVHEGRDLDAVDSNCSGKHSGMLASCAAMGWPLDGYMLPDHPCQQAIVKLIAEMCKVAPESIGIAADGCGVPVHYMAINAMAVGYARLVRGDDLPEQLKEASARIVRAMTEHPEMISGTGGFCSELIREARGSVVGKIGADGVYCFGITDLGVGCAVKVEDGNGQVLPAIVMSALRQLGAFPHGVPEALAKYVRPVIKTGAGEKCGEIIAAFQLGTFQSF